MPSDNRATGPTSLKSSTTTPPIPFIVLSMLPLGDNDTLLKIVEPRAGILSVVLKNNRRVSSSGRPPKTLDLFDQANASFTIRRAGMPTFSKFERLPAFRNIREDFVKFTGISTLAEATLLLFHEQSESDSSLYKAVLSAFTNLNSSPTARDTFRELTLSLNKVLSLSGFGSEKLPLVVTRGHQITQKSNLTYRSSDSRSISESTELYRTSREDSTIMESTLDYSLTDNTLSQKKNRSIQNYTPTCTPPPEEELSLSNTTYTANREELLKGIAPSPRVLRYLITEIESTTGKKLRSTPSLFQILNSLSLQQTRP